MDMEEDEEEDRFTWNPCVHALRIFSITSFERFITDRTAVIFLKWFTMDRSIVIVD